ncbi:MAG: FAD-dependent oxidoreductase [Chloroflexi bacterium]|nr:FAD-dependent oxidoreductase [Chloroflexota bacterium]
MQKRVVILGSGAAGCAAAVAAASKGASVTLLERANDLGGTTAWGGGGIWIPANPYAAAEGSPDTFEAALLYLRSVGLGDSDRELAERYVHEGVRILADVERHTPLRWNTIRGFPDYHAELPGGRVQGGRSLEIDSVPVGRDMLGRMRPNPYRSLAANRREIEAGIDAAEISRRERDGIVAKGVGVCAAMCMTAERLGATLRTGRRATRLVPRDGAIIGVEADGEVFEGQVIVATGGFERDAALVRAFLRGPMTAPGSPPTNRGDGLRMGMAVGAALGNMSEAWWAPAYSAPGELVDGEPFFRMLFGDRAQPGGIIVDSRGRRYANEATNYNDFGRAMHDFDPSAFTFPRVPSWFIFDASRRARFTDGPLAAGNREPDWLRRAARLEDLAKQIGVPADTLRETIERYNSHADRGVDMDFGRGSSAWDAYSAGFVSPRDQLRPLTEPPYYAIQVQVGCLGTKGGLKIDGYGRVQRADRSGPIPGLFAAGNAAANPFGMAYPSGGATVGPAIVFGWLAGETAAML